MSSRIDKVSTDTNSMISKFSQGLIVNIFLRIKGIIYVPLLVNFVSKEDLGEISYVKAIVGLLTGVVLLNIPDASNRLILKEKDSWRQGQIINSISNFCFVFGLLFTSVMMTVAIWLKVFDMRVLLIISAMLFSSIIDKLAKYVFQIFQNTKLLSIVILFTEYISLGIVSLVLYKNLYSDILIVLYIYALVVLISAIFLLLRIYKEFPFRCVIDMGVVKKTLKISLFLFPASYSIMVIQSSDYIIIERFIGLDELGVYSFSYSLASLVSGLSLAVSFFWYSSVVYSTKQQISEILNKVLKFSVLVLVLIIGSYAASTDYIIEIVNSGYEEARNIIMILIIGFFLAAINQIYQGIMYARGDEKLILFDTTIAALLNLIMNIVFIPQYGILFAAVSTSLSYLLLFTIRTRYIKRHYTTSFLDKKIVFSVFIIFISLINITYYLWISL